MFKTIFLAYIRRLKRDDLSTYAAQIAFFSLLSILPFLLMISMWLSRSNILDINGIDLAQLACMIPRAGHQQYQWSACHAGKLRRAAPVRA